MLKEESRDALKTLRKTHDEKGVSANAVLTGKSDEESLIRDLNYYDLPESGVSADGK